MHFPKLSIIQKVFYCILEKNLHESNKDKDKDIFFELNINAKN